MNVGLVEPPRPNLAVPGAVTPLGLGYIAAMVRQQIPGIDCSILNLSGATQDEALAQIHGYDVVGYTCSSLDYPELVSLVRQVDRGQKHVIGGPHVTAMNGDVDDIFDAAFIGEGEYTFVEYLYDLLHKQTRRAYRATIIEDLDELPFPIRDFTHPGGALITGGSSTSAAIMASRGCPYNCAFCSSRAVWSRRVRVRSVANIVAEICDVRDRCKVNDFWFADDNICVRPAWLEELCAQLKPLGIHWRASIRANLVDEKTLKLLHEGGCTELAVGIESFDDNVLKVLNKHSTAAKNLQAIKAIHAAGIGTRVLLMISTPGESATTVDTNIKALQELRPYADRFVLSTFMPMPGSPITETPEAFGVQIIELDLSKYDIRMWKPNMTDMHTHWSPILIDGLSRDQQLDNIKRMREFIAACRK